MTIRQPSWFFRALILGAQGVYYNLFCELFLFDLHATRLIEFVVLAYMISPRICHRFVAYLEEEAVVT